jgi:hypothetical protein
MFIMKEEKEHKIIDVVQTVKALMSVPLPPMCENDQSFFMIIEKVEKSLYVFVWGQIKQGIINKGDSIDVVGPRERFRAKVKAIHRIEKITSKEISSEVISAAAGDYVRLMLTVSGEIKQGMFLQSPRTKSTSFLDKKIKIPEIKEESTIKTVIRLAYESFFKGDFENSLHCLNEVINYFTNANKSPKDNELFNRAIFFKAFLLEIMGKTVEAQEYYQKAYNLSECCQDLASLFWGNRDPETGLLIEDPEMVLVLYDRALKVDPKNSTV